ncbi:type II CRISPR RNA-guided endonuclease Cas9 [uncultured Lutibacter sp.]|uniref:type II CRISPR RNA-guided endonuclease Cas9 n=1 Tax=uncultured Lutibacter sp. TaxID=437739 RepID=UPI00261955B2|nr:type II CRISPR RNA-guided endonuclease Cas9 [uncultured Lutibacter sp.]
MKKILGLDLGTTSIGWALVNEAEYKNEKSEIIKLGVRVNPLTTDEQTDFEKGRPLSINADRTLKRGARRNLQRFKLRRKNLIEILEKHQIITNKTALTEIGKNTTHQTLSLRAKAAVEKIELEDFAKVLLAINKKRGYKSSRKSINEDEGIAVDGMAVAKKLYEDNITPGQYVYQLLIEGKKYIPDFYRSDLQNEFDKVWTFQKQFYPDVLDDELYKALQGQGQQNSRKRFLAIKGIYTAENKGKRDVIKLQHYKWRANSISKQLSIEEVAYAIVEINNNLNNSSGYLGAISDRSKKLYFKKITVGQYLYNQIQKNRHTSLKNQVFYRQDYLDEFEQIWETQARYYPVLTKELKEEIRDVIIFYQRKLKSQKHLISNCQFEKYHKAIPKSSPLFQEFKIWHNLNHLEFKNKSKGIKLLFIELDDEVRERVFNECNIPIKLKLSKKDLEEDKFIKPDFVLKLISEYIEIGNVKEWKCNFEKIEGNRTNQALYAIYQEIAENEGYGFDWSKKSALEIKEELKAVFKEIGIKPEILDFDSNKEASEFDKQYSYQLWHLLYSAEDDHKISEEDKLIYGNSNVALKKKLHTKYGFKPDYAKWLANIKLQQDYGSLSSRAIRKILPYLQNGNEFSEACTMAGYNHSNSLTKEELDKRVLKDTLDLLPKNSLRNPVVEKILNQMVNLINQVIKIYGKPDEVRIELARELKKSASERQGATRFINDNTRANEEIRKIIKKDFGFDATKSDVVRYKLYKELAPLGHKTIFTNRKIDYYTDLFSKKVEIEHIIPKAVLYDDSFSNKTLAFSEINKQKDKRTAFDFIDSAFNSDLENYKSRIELLYNKGKGIISKGKYKKLLMSQQNLSDGFIERDKVNTQYISKKANELLSEVVRKVTPIPSGKITSKLREEWGLINVMKELNFPKYKALGLTEIQQRLDIGQEKKKEIEIIKDWTKRNDHRHHAIDALTVAFTSHNHIQYLNNLSTRKDTNYKKHSNIIGIENLITHKIDTNKRKFIPPIENFRSEAKQQIESIIVSFKTKNKVVTKNINKTNKGGGFNKQKTKTPRGRMHEDTYCGMIKVKSDKKLKLKTSIELEQIEYIFNPTLKELIKKHLLKFENNPKIAFSSKILKTDNIIYKGNVIDEVEIFEDIMVVRKPITSDLNISKVIDKGIQKVLSKRLQDFNNNKKKAFSDIENNPIWLNKEKGISIKTVRIKFQFQNIKENALHYKKNHLGEFIYNESRNKIPKDYVNLGNNHHVSIYRDEKGKLQEKVVSFYEAVKRKSYDLPVVFKDSNEIFDYIIEKDIKDEVVLNSLPDKTWKFLFTMKQNEFFVFPTEDFNPNEMDLMDERNAKKISNHLFRVQILSSKYYLFSHHLETQATTGEDLKNLKMLSGKKYQFIRTPENLKNIVKIRTNHLGQIVQVGEY